jgi:hypothetical protein
MDPLTGDRDGGEEKNSTLLHLPPSHCTVSEPQWMQGLKSVRRSNHSTKSYPLNLVKFFFSFFTFFYSERDFFAGYSVFATPLLLSPKYIVFEGCLNSNPENFPSKQALST